jgi:hypothetical protein
MPESVTFSSPPFGDQQPVLQLTVYFNSRYRFRRFHYFAIELQFGTELSLDTVPRTINVNAHKAQTCAAVKTNVRATLVLLPFAVTDLRVSQRFTLREVTPCIPIYMPDFRLPPRPK